MIDLNEVTISSKRFAKLIGKDHDSVLKECDILISEGLIIDTGNPKAEEKEYRISPQVSDRLGVDLSDKFQELKELVDYLSEKRKACVLAEEEASNEDSLNLFCAIYGIPRKIEPISPMKEVKFETNSMLEEKANKPLKLFRRVTEFEGYNKDEQYLSNVISDVILEFFGLNISPKEVERIAKTYHLTTSEFITKEYFDGSFYTRFRLPTSNYIVKFFKIENGII